MNFYDEGGVKAYYFADTSKVEDTIICKTGTHTIGRVKVAELKKIYGANWSPDNLRRRI